MKGFDPLIATVVLIIIAVAVSAIIANWQSWFLPSYASRIERESRSALQCSRASIALENVTFDCRGNCLPGVQHMLTATIRNTGDISLPLYDLLLENAAGATLAFPLNTILPIDRALDYTNTSAVDCQAFSRSVTRVIVTTACASMPSAFDGSIVTWINC
ncbi:MAG: hypothetical protein QW548_02375 [Candidatus Aenigmatarchaeota archaeon]